MMRKKNVIVLGAGIVGISAALHLQKRGVETVLVDRHGPGEGTSYGNAGIIEGNTLFPYPFPRSIRALARVAFKLATEANYHAGFLPRIARWLLNVRAATTPAGLESAARTMRPLFERALAEHEALIGESGAQTYLRKTGWLRVYRSEQALDKLAAELALADEYGIPYQTLDQDGALAMEPSLAPVVRHGVFWPNAASFSNPLGVSRAYHARFQALGGRLAKGDAKTLRKKNGGWSVTTDDGEAAADEAVVALGPWSPDLLEPLGIDLPLAVKRGYHWHFQAKGNARLSRPVLDAEVGFILGPMEQGIRLTTGAEFAHRDAKPTPVQIDRLMPYAKELFPLGEPVEPKPWMGSRPCFWDSRPVVGRAPGQNGLWLDYGHGHSGLTLGPVTGRLLAEMMTGETPFCDPAPFRAERFLSPG
jgi:D-amino-acid dehydrogenase